MAMLPVIELPHALVFWPVFAWACIGEWRLYREAVSTPDERLM